MDINYLKPLLESKINELGYELIEIKVRREQGDLVLSIVVDRVEPIDMNAIVEVSGAISSYLDEIDKSEEKYFLDVSSLGAEKPLKVEDLPKYVSRYVNVHITNPIEGENIFEGELSEVNDDSITITYKVKTRVKKVVILQSNIYKIRLAIKF
ncbi:MAG: ribosome maturation factor RimP [Bacilli bacterium]|nr:ribosome maturation factor RimP [Bacilli bacterium]